MKRSGKRGATRRAARRFSILAMVSMLSISAFGAEPVSATANVKAARHQNGRIVFRRYLTDDHTYGAIFSIRSAGGGLFRVTHDGKHVVSTEPAPSPDGRWIAYMKTPEGDTERGRLFKIRPSGKDRTALSRTCSGQCQADGFPAWSPTGRRIAFQRSRTADPNKPVGFTSIFVMNANGTNPRQITQRSADTSRPGRFEDQAPAWSPKGHRLAFERTKNKTGRQAVFTVRLNGEGVRRITPWRLDASQPDYSPNGRWIVFRSNEPDDIKGNLWLVHPDGSGLRKVTHAKRGKAKWLSAGFSPDGRFLVAGRTTIKNGEQQNADVFRLKIDGSDRQNVTKDSSHWDSAADWGAGRS